jgi:general secretion pathway protein D
VVQATISSGQTVTAQLPLPHFRVRQVTTSAIVWDGQTVVLGGLITEDVIKVKDRVPLLGSIPGLGRLFRSEGTSTSKKNLVIFVTPRIIDPAGNPVHADDELPFAQASIPTQKPASNP